MVKGIPNLKAGYISGCYPALCGECEQLRKASELGWSGFDEYFACRVNGPHFLGITKGCNRFEEVLEFIDGAGI
jgi:hypothetical protein